MLIPGSYVNGEQGFLKSFSDMYRKTSWDKFCDV